jgi:hypothetical protein
MVILMALMLVFATAPVLAQPGWVQMAPFTGPGADTGCALCTGNATEPGGYKQCIWLLHGGSNWFERYDVTGHAWERMADIPGDAVGWGGALAYVPDPFAYPWPRGLVFALKGKNTPDFKVYCPDNNAWVSLLPVPQNVTAGGALCYGGEVVVDGLRCAILYALTGQSNQDGGYFYRYLFPEAPSSDPGAGHWEKLGLIRDPVSPGAALAWNPVFDPTQWLWVLTAFVGNISNLWQYINPFGPPFWRQFFCTTWNQNKGACMTGFNLLGDSRPCVAMLYGSGHVDPAGDWWCDLHWPVHGTFDRQADTPLEVDSGSALAYVVTQEAFVPTPFIYAEFGRQDPPSRSFYRLKVPTSSGSGTQSSGTAAQTATRVQTLAGRDQTRFVVSGQAGTVRIKILSSAGRVVAALSTSPSAGRAEFVWSHKGVPSGVYLYAVSGVSGVLTGKVMVVR